MFSSVPAAVANSQQMYKVAHFVEPEGFLNSASGVYGL